MLIWALNPGGNSLKAQIAECDTSQRYAFESTECAGLSIERIEKGRKAAKGTLFNRWRKVSR